MPRDLEGLDLSKLSDTELEELLEQVHEQAVVRGRTSMLGFTQFTKDDYEVNWHHEELCQVLDDFVEGKIRFLMVFMPPRHGKSELVSVRLPAYIHGRYPNAEIMAASYNLDLASTMTVAVQRVMDTPEYRELFPNSQITPEGSRTKYARNNEEHELLPIEGKEGAIIRLKGKYRGQGVGGTFTGKGANFVLIDDPVKGRKDADSEAFRKHLWNFYKSDLRSRLEKGGQVLLTLTRWHEDDLAGKILELMKNEPDADKFKVFMLPATLDAESIEERKRPEMLPVKDPRKIGDPLWPNKYNVQDLKAIKAGGTRDWLSLYQQRPTSEEGNVFKRIWWKAYKQDQKPKGFHEIIQSWDFSVTDSNGADYTVGQVWGRRGVEKYLLDEVRRIADFPAQVNMVKLLSAKWPQARKKLVEKKANGPAVVSSLKKLIGGLIEVEPQGDKVARANACTPDIEAGNVYLPHKEDCPWIEDYLAELSAFPNAKKDDRVDATSQALNELFKRQILHAPTAGHSG